MNVFIRYFSIDVNLKIVNENIPFSLFISTQRRKKILASMMSKDPSEKKEGEKILANYKK